MRRSLRFIFVCLLPAVFFSLINTGAAVGQVSPGATGSTTSSSASGPGSGAGSGGSASIEPQLMAYAALQELGASICGSISTPAKNILILDEPLGTQLSNYYSVRAQIDYFKHQFAPPAITAKDLSSYAAPIVSLLGLLKNGVTYSSQSFQANPAPLIQGLVAQSGCQGFVQLSSVNHLDDAQKDISKQLITLEGLHSAAHLDPTTSALESLYQTFLKSLSSPTTAGGSVLSDAIVGDAIVTAVCGSPDCPNGFYTLQLTIDGAGGNIRQNNFFFLNFFYTPQPSFNAGVEVTWSLYDSKNHYSQGGTLKRMYGYSKWHPNKFKWQGDPKGNDIQSVSTLGPKPAGGATATGTSGSVSPPSTSLPGSTGTPSGFTESPDKNPTQK